MDKQPGEKLDRYTIEGLLGEGGMGRVYRARDPKLDRAVALKVLRVDGDDSPDGTARRSATLLREARAAAALEHTNAVAIHDVGEAEGIPFIAMELVDGPSLRTFVGDGLTPVETRARWLLSIARALAAAHARGLVHRDIKPENVMLRKDGTIKVLDFGIARIDLGGDARPAAVSSRRNWMTGATGTDGRIAGTPGYMAPEQWSSEPTDARTDQFSWGVLAYELLTGRLPWGGDTTSYEHMARVLHEEPLPFDWGASPPEPALERTILRALAKDPADRFPGMADVVAALEEREGGGVARARTGDTELPRSRTGRRPSRIAWAALAAGVTALLAAAAPLLRPGTTPAMTPSAAPARSVTKLADLAVPSSEVGEARSEYVAGMQSLRDASIIPGVRHFVRAAKLDPGMAVAHLRILTHGREISEAEPRAHFEKLRELRALLSPRDQALLTAIEPLYVTIPPDEAEVTRRIAALAESFPDDAELHYLAGARELDPVIASRRWDEALAIDPDFALVLWRKANASLTLGEFPAALALLDRCVTLVPSSTACLTVRALVSEELGSCEAVLRDARIVEMVSPSARSHDLVARGLYATGAPLPAVREVLQRKWAAAEKADDFPLFDEAHLAVLSGDFVSAERLLRQAAAHVEASAVEEDHKGTIWPLVNLLFEEGKAELASQEADRYLRAREGWQSSHEWSPVPVMMAAAERGGLRTRKERNAAVEAWVASWGPRAAAYPGQAWVFGLAVPAATEAEGVAAVASVPVPTPRAHANQFHREGLGAVGKALALGGRWEEAIPLLRAAASSCSTLQVPLEHTQASLHLGRALESAGDGAGACAAYRVVLTRWGSAKPRSVSADLARSRTRALGCEGAR